MKNIKAIKLDVISSVYEEEKISNDWSEIKKRAVEELEAMAATAKEDAMAIHCSIVSPDDDPEIAVYQLLLLNERIKCKVNFYSLIEFVEIVRRNTASSYARKGHASNRIARTFVENEWNDHRVAYDGNKSAFTRHYVKRVFNEFNVSITEKQMREVWLKDEPVASKQAG